MNGDQGTTCQVLYFVMTLRYREHVASKTDERWSYLVVEAAGSERSKIADNLGFLASHLDVVHTRNAVLEQVKSARRFAGIIIDAELPGESALDVLTCLRDEGIYTPTLVLAYPEDTEVWTTAQCHGAYLSPKPMCPKSLLAFIHWTKRRREAAYGHLEEEVRALGERHGFTARERELVRLAASGVARHELMTALRVEESTVKTTVRRLLRKARRSTLSEVVAEVHRALFVAREQREPSAPGASPLE